jgi:hypothetical protein
VPTWIWLEEATFGEVSVTARSGPNHATVTARPTGMSVTAPDAAQEGNCASGGTAWSPRAGDTDTDCTLTFRRSSARQPGATATITVRTRWDATWTGSGGTGGTLDGSTATTTLDRPVAEVHTLVTTTD